MRALERGVAAAVGLVLVAGVVTAVARTGGEGADPAQVVLAAADTALAASSAQVEMLFSVEAAGMMPTEGVTMRFTGAVDLDRGMVELSGTLPMGLDLHVIQHGTTHYFRAAAPNGDRPDGWIRIDADGALADEQAAMLPGAQDPTDMLGMLREIGDVEHLGTDRVDDREYDRYRAVIDPNLLLAQQEHTMTPEEAQLFRDATRSAVMEVWLDDAGLPGRMTTVIEMAIPDHGEMRMGMQIDFRNWNEPVGIAVPPDEAVIERHVVSTHEDYTQVTAEIHQRAFAQH